MFYNAFIKPPFDYCNTVWSILSLRYSDIDIKTTPSEKILGVHVDDDLM